MIRFQNNITIYHIFKIHYNSKLTYYFECPLERFAFHFICFYSAKKKKFGTVHGTQGKAYEYDVNGNLITTKFLFNSVAKEVFLI